MTKLANKVLIWDDCYGDGWQGVITKESFAHPAKFSKALIERIFDHCLQRGWLKKNDLVGDCFGGIGNGGIVAAYRGLRWVGVELEPRFVQFAELNFEFHEDKLRTLGLPLPRILQGDSRRFAEIVSGAGAVVTSPPYVDSMRGLEHNGIDVDKLNANNNHAGQSSMAASKEIYGKSDGQIARLPSGTVAAVLTSPPYADSVNAKAHGIDWDKVDPKATGSRKRGAGSKHAKTLEDQLAYGTAEGQIGALKSGSVDCVVTSPPYAHIAAGAGGLNTKPAKHAGQQSGRNGESASQTADQRYGDAPGQIAGLSEGVVDAVITSPPFTQGHKGGGGINVNGYGDGSDKVGERTYQGQGGDRTDGNIETLQPGDLNAVVTSPPYDEGLGHGGGRVLHQPRRPGTVTLQGQKDGYGEAAGQIGNLKGGKIDGIVTSPPYMANDKSEHPLADDGVTRRRDEKDEHAQGRGCMRGSHTYGQTEGQIGQEKTETYWQAMAAVYASCYAAIKPGGVIAVVVKDYVAKRKRVPLCDDTARLLEHCGFQIIERVHAMLTKETRHGDLFNGETVTTKSRKSFFRRLAEKKGSPPIDFEQVIFAQRA